MTVNTKFKRLPGRTSDRLVNHVYESILAERGEVANDGNDTAEKRVARWNATVDRLRTMIAAKENELLHGQPPAYPEHAKRIRKMAIEAITPQMSDEECHRDYVKLMYAGPPSRARKIS